MTRDSIEYNEVIQVIREMGLVMFYTAPADMNLDRGTMDMFSCQIQTVSLDKINRICVVKYKFKEGKYWKFLQDKGNIINRVVIPKADQQLIQAYKPLKRKFMGEKVKVNIEEKQMKKDPVNIEVYQKKIMDNIGEFSKMYHGKRLVDKTAIYYKYRDEGMTHRDAQEIKRRIEKNGL